MKDCLLFHRATRRPLSSIFQRIPPLSYPSAFVPHTHAQRIHQDVAPQNGQRQHRFAYIEDGEPPERYRPGGYHPLSIGDVLHQRYRIVHKLGFGSYSTTWLAKDIQGQDKYAAIKIKTAGSNHDSNEARTWRHLWSAANACPTKDGLQQHAPGGVRSIPPIWDEFRFDGPNGTHPCIVTDPARMTVAEAQDASFTRLFQPSVARAIAAQLIQAVAFVHALGYAHADLHLGNVLLKLPKGTAVLPPEQLYETFGSPVLEPVRIIGDKREQSLPVGVPSHIVIPAWFGTKSEDMKLHEASVVLTDFGEAFMPSTERRYRSNTPRTLRPPESRFAPETPLSLAADIWTVACSIWTILGQRSLFDVFSFTDDDVTRQQVDALGALPQDWWARWDTRAKYYDSQGNLLDPTSERMDLEDRFENSIQRPRRECGIEPVGDEEKVALLGMLRAMLAFVPEERPTAASLVDCEWMTKWALPCLSEMDRLSNETARE